MQPSKRQIIKTRPQRPYIIARIMVLIILVAALSVAAWFFIRPHPAHALPAVAVELGSTVDFTSTVPVILTGEEAPFPERSAHVQLSVERVRS
ncbi:MAG TPA: hypothetical protein VN860_04815 [Candidatus Acidoferrales bacterium]|nr:hypothetical protein [Candidatus Acidoferrales bacterium]